MTAWSDQRNLSDEGTAKPDIYAANIVEARDDDGRAKAKRLVRGIGAAVSIVVRKLVAKTGWKSQPDIANVVTEGVQNATELATSAVTGKLEGASLEGDLKRAQIAELYANARKSNAEAGKIERETAWLEMERCIEIAQLLGASVGVSKLADGRLCLTMGEGLSIGVPIVTVQSQQVVSISEANPPGPSGEAVMSSVSISVNATGMVSTQSEGSPEAGTESPPPPEATAEPEQPNS